MAEHLQNLSAWFWKKEHWLLPGYDWEDYLPNENTQMANWDDLWSYPFYIAAVAIAVRFLILNPFLYEPLARKCGFKETEIFSLVPNKLLEKVFHKYKGNVPSDVICESAKTLQWKERKVEHWLRQRILKKRATSYKKFIECSWVFTYYTTIFSFGLYILWDKPWLWDINECYHGYPFHSVEPDIWWYYMLSLGFYWSMTFTLFFELRREDFWQMLGHHFITICLITFSWAFNGTRIGSLVLILHDFADIPLQITKLCIYAASKHVIDLAFRVLALVWIISKLIVFPLWIIRFAMFGVLEFIPIYLAYYIINSLLVSLQCLHIFWVYRIIRIIIESSKMVEGKLGGAQKPSAYHSKLLKGHEVKKD